ncbi:MAG: YraN family protein, partial [Acidimicrobiia bacterium]|nr:YraN family protein [Acidimicrobiia bacterium]
RTDTGPRHRPASLTVGHAGERIAARSLVDRGFTVLAANHRTPAGEADLIVGLEDRRWVVEVKTGVGGGAPIDRIDEAKHARLWAIAGFLDADGVLLVEVRLTAGGAVVAWSPG